MQAIVRLQELRERQGAEKLRQQRIVQEKADEEARQMQRHSESFENEKPVIVRNIYDEALSDGQTSDTLMQINIGLDRLDEKGRQLQGQAADKRAQAETEHQETDRLRADFARLNRKTEKWRRLTDRQKKTHAAKAQKREEAMIEEQVGDGFGRSRPENRE